MGNWQDRPERDAREQRRQHAPYEDQQLPQTPRGRPVSRALSAPPARRPGAQQPADQRMPHPPYPQRPPVAPSRPLISGQPLVGGQRAGSPPHTEQTPTWRRWLPMASGALAGIVLVAIAVVLLSLLHGSQQPAALTLKPPQPTASALCADLMAQRYTEAYSLLTPQLRQQGTQAQYAASQRELDTLQGRVTACRVGILSVAGTNATGALTITRLHTHPMQATLALVWNGSAWQISAYDSSIV